MAKNSLDVLLEEVSRLIASPQNQEVKEIWEPQPGLGVVPGIWWRGIPRTYSPKAKGRFAVIADPGFSFWAKVLAINLIDHHSQPEKYLEDCLRIISYHFHEFKDDTYFTSNLPLWFYGAAFEPVLFGLKIRFLPDKDPWIYEQPLIEKPEDLDSLRPPDFYEGGIMPALHQFYQRLKELAGPKLTIRFPEWIRGPFGVAMYLRGAENLLIDIMIRPEFVHKLMRFITNSQKKWTAERAKFLGIKIEKGFLYNDDVSCPTLSPRMYEEFVLPYEIELCQFQGGIRYWHSCGNITKLLPIIKQIPILDMLHVSPWTDLEEAAKIFKGVALEICLHPVDDVLAATKEQAEGKIRKIVDICTETGVRRYFIRSGSIHPLKKLEEDLEQIHSWIKMVKKLSLEI